MENSDKLISLIKNKKILFAATKNCDYIRNSQETDLIKKYSKESTIVCLGDKSYPLRLIKVYFRLFKELLKNKYDVVFIGFSPQLLLPFYIFNFFGKAEIIITDFFISVYDTFVDDRKKVKDNSIISKIMKQADIKTLKKSTFAISDTKAHGNFFCEEFGFKKDNMITLYLKADTSFYHPMDIERPPKIKNKFVVVYFGGMQNVHGADVIFDAIKILQNEEDIFFYIIGPVKDNLKEKCKNLKNIEMISWLSQDKLAEYISFADVGLGGHFNGKIRKSSNTIPGKVYIFKAMDKKVILGDTPANRELFEENDENIFVETQNPSALAAAIKNLSQKEMHV